MTLSVLPAVARLAAAARDDRTDSGLLHAFLRSADEAAFAELVQRHGPLVLGVCRRVLGRSADADDAFQATFLVLVRRARQTAWRESLGPWLYGVAGRIARKARFVRSRRAATERQVSPMTPEPVTPAPEPDDEAAILDEELAALPELFRRPLVLCELQGKSRKEAARELGLAEGTLSSRLARGRRMLRDRLTRRGVGPVIVGLVATVPAGLVTATAGRAVAMATGAAGVVPAAILSLTEGMVKSMIVNWKLAAVMVAAGIGLSGFGGWDGTSRPTATVAAAEPPGPPTHETAKPTPAHPSGVRVDVPALGPVPIALDFAFPLAGDNPGLSFTYFGSYVIEPPDPNLPVATIFGDEKLTRQQFGEYLMRKYGKNELELFVNKQIIARAFAKKGWRISADDIRGAIDAQAKTLGVIPEKFEQPILQRFGKSKSEWIEDVLIPQLMLARLCKDKVKPPTECEIRQAFDRKYGEKRECQMIVCSTEAEAAAIHKSVSTSEDAFERESRRQSDPGLAASGGRVHPPIPACGIMDDEAEHAVLKVVGKLRVGEVSQPVAIGKGFAIIKCTKVIPADTTKSFENEKPMLLQEVLEAKLTREMPKLFVELKREADPKYHLTFPDSAPNQPRK